jgi:hypothetical protein
MCADGIGSCEVRAITFNFQSARSSCKERRGVMLKSQSLPMQVASWQLFTTRSTPIHLLGEQQVKANYEDEFLAVTLQT